MEVWECKQVVDLYQTQLQKITHHWINQAKYFMIHLSYISVDMVEKIFTKV